MQMFDGASRNNPGRGGYGYALFDLYKHKLIAKGCRTLPYGNLAVVTEFHGLLAGLDAAKQLGIKRLAIAVSVYLSISCLFACLHMCCGCHLHVVVRWL